MQIVNASGTVVASYEYDPYGNIISATGTLAEINPLRYRGYVYDSEIGLYYLQSRYYNAKIGRFLNADSYASTGQGILGNNMFAYCGNQPISYSDQSGHYSITAQPMLHDGSGRSNYIDKYYRDSYDQIHGFINGQGIFEFADEGIGFGSYATSGCAFIAIYNALQLLSCPQSLGLVRDEFLYEHGTLLWGAWGAAPCQFDAYFDKHNISYKGYRHYNEFLSDLKNGDIIVFTVTNNVYNPFDAFHTMAAQYVNGTFIVYNVYSNNSDSRPMQSLDGIYNHSHWMYGYILGG